MDTNLSNMDRENLIRVLANADDINSLIAFDVDEPLTETYDRFRKIGKCSRKIVELCSKISNLKAEGGEK